MPQPLRPADLTGIPTTTIRERKSRLHLESLAAPPEATAPALAFLTSLPKVGLAHDLNEAARQTREAIRREHTVVVLVGRDIAQAGYSPLIAALMERGGISAVAMDGRSALYDFELSSYGQTDEEPSAPSYGSSREVGEAFNHILNEGVARGFGLGEFLGRSLLERAVRHVEYSILAHGSAKRVPVTIHPLIGADPVHRYASASGAVIGKGAHRDFLLFMGQLQGLANGGLVLDLWSEGLHGVFEQAMAAARQASRHTLTNWQYIQFRPAGARQTDPPSWESVDGVSHTVIEGDPLLLSMLYLGIAGAEV